MTAPLKSSGWNINPAWETADYQVCFLFGVCLPAAVRKWTKWRRIKWRRQQLRKQGVRFWFPDALPDPRLNNFPIHPDYYRGEVS
jgi:hypothetical protein